MPRALVEGPSFEWDVEVVSAADRALWQAVRGWAAAKHAGSNQAAALSVKVWARAKGLS